MRTTLILLPAIVLAVAATAGCSSGDSDETARTTDQTRTNAPLDAAAAPPANGAAAVAAADPVTAAIAAGKAENRPVLVEFWSKSCGYCKQMDKETLSHDDVKAAMGDFVHVKVVEEVNGRLFRSRWPGAGSPSFVAFADGEQVGDVLSGVVAKDDFLKWLAWAKTGEGGAPAPAISVGGT